MFDKICKPFDALLKGIGGALFGESFSLTLPIALLTLLVVGVVWFFLISRAANSSSFLNTVEGEVKISLPWYSAVALLGIFVATPSEFRVKSFIMSLFLEEDTELLWSNFMEWHGFIRICFIAVIVGILFLAVVNSIVKGVRGLLTMLFGMALVFLLGYSLQMIRVLLCMEVLGGFLSWALNMICLIPEAVLMILFPISFVVFLMSPSSIHTYVENKEKKHRYNRYSSSSYSAESADGDSAAPFSVHIIPENIKGPYARNYHRINISTDYAEYQTDYDGSIVKIHDGDITMSGRGARVGADNFYW